MLRMILAVIGDWWTFRKVRPADVASALDDGRLQLHLHTRSWFKPVIVTDVTREELESLRDMIDGMLEDEAPE